MDELVNHMAPASNALFETVRDRLADERGVHIETAVTAMVQAAKTVPPHE